MGEKDNKESKLNSKLVAHGIEAEKTLGFFMHFPTNNKKGEVGNVFPGNFQFRHMDGLKISESQSSPQTGELNLPVVDA